jgi:hypothetical protein
MAYSVRFGYCTMEYTMPIHEGLIAGSELMLTIRLIKGTQLMVLAKSSMPPQKSCLSWAIRWVGIAKVNRDLAK